jgi:hypothetical protein
LLARPCSGLARKVKGTIRIRKFSNPELWHLRIYNALGLSPKVGKIIKELL